MRSLYLLFPLFVFSCTLIPKYEPPCTIVPCEWHSCLSSGMDDSVTDGFLWWKSLTDPLLDSLIERAACQNLDLSIATSRILQARIESADGLKLALPHIDGSMNYGALHYNHDTLKDFLGLKKRSISDKNNLNFFEIGFDAKWEIDLLNLGKSERNRLKAQLEASCWNYYHVWVILSSEIAKNYIDLRGQQLRLILLEKAYDAQKEIFQLSKDLYKTGFTDPTIFMQAEEQMGSLSAEKLDVELSITQAIHRLSILLGLQPCELFEELKTAASLPTIPYHKPLGIPSGILRRRPDILRAERNLAQSSESVSTTIVSLFPRLTLRGFIGNITSFKSNSFTAFGGLKILAPIFNSELIKQNIQLEKAKAKEAFYEYQKTVLSALEETENALASYHAGVGKERLFANIVHSKQEEYQFSSQLYQTGWKNYLDVLSARRALISAEEKFLQTQVELLLDYITLYKTLGGGWE